MLKATPLGNRSIKVDLVRGDLRESREPTYLNHFYPFFCFFNSTSFRYCFLQRYLEIRLYYLGYHTFLTYLCIFLNYSPS